MQRSRTRHALIAVVGVLSLAAIGAACTPPVYGGPPTANVSFRATSVTVNSVNDDWNITCFCYKDEPRVLNIGFRVKMGVANSAAAQVSVGDNPWPGLVQQGLGSGQSHTFSASQQGTVTFNAVNMPDIADLLQGAALEIVGVWAWKVEDDGILAANVNNIANAIAPAIVSALNSTLALATVPNDANQIVSAILTAIGNLGFFNLFATVFTGLMNNLNILSDDVTGSAMYVGVGGSGTVGAAVNAFEANFPAIQIPSLIVPPDIGGGRIFSLSSAPRNFSNNFTNAGVDGQHTYNYTFG